MVGSSRGSYDIKNLKQNGEGMKEIVYDVELYECPVVMKYFVADPAS